MDCPWRIGSFHPFNSRNLRLARPFGIAELGIDFMIRIALPDDAPAIHELHTRSVRGLCACDYPEEVVEGWLLGRSPEGYKGIAKKEMYVFEESGAICGFSHVVPRAIVALFVDPEHARRGVGRALFEHALGFIRGSGAVPIPFEATITALPFYLKMGCTEIRRSFVEKNHIKVETVLMSLPKHEEAGCWPSAENCWPNPSGRPTHEKL